MTRNFPAILFSLLISPSLAAQPPTKQAEQKPPAQDREAEALEKNAAQVKLEFTRSLDRVKRSLSKCWRPDKNFNGSLAFRLTLEKDGKVKNIMRFVGDKNDTADELTAMAAIKSCQPYKLPTSYRNSNSLDVVLTKQVEIFSHADMDASTAKPSATTQEIEKISGPTLTSEEITKLRKQVATCMKESDFDPKSDIELELHLNQDGTVAPSSKILSATTPEIGGNVLQATFQCQPYLLPAEKYAVWKALILVFVAGGGPK